MANKAKYLRPVADRAVDQLVAHHQEHGALPSELVQEHAARSGYSVRHLRRLVSQRLERAAARHDQQPSFAIDETVVAAVFLACGCLARAYRLLERRDVDLPSLSTFKRHVTASLGTAQLAYAKKGSAGFRDAKAYLASRYPHRLHTVLLDHTELPIWVVRNSQDLWISFPR